MYCNICNLKREQCITPLTGAPALSLKNNRSMQRTLMSEKEGKRRLNLDCGLENQRPLCGQLDGHHAQKINRSVNQT